MVLWKCCTQNVSKFRKLSSGHRTGKTGSVFIPIPRKGNAKECSNYCTIALISHTSKVILKMLQAKLQQYMNWELPYVQAGFRKGRGTRDQIASICWIIEKAKRIQKKKSTFASLTMLSLRLWITKNCENSWNDGGTRSWGCSLHKWDLYSYRRAPDLTLPVFQCEDI